MLLHERVRAIARVKCGSGKKLSEKMHIDQGTYSGYLNPKREHNLWPLLPKILELFPDISRDWLYFGEGDMHAAPPAPIIPEAAPIGGNLFEIVDRLGGEAVMAQAGGISVKDLRAITNGEDFPSAQTLARWLASARLSANFVLANVGPVFVTDDMLLNSFAGQASLREIRLRDLRQQVARDLGMDNMSIRPEAEPEHQQMKERIEELKYTIEIQKQMLAAYERGNMGNSDALGMSNAAPSPLHASKKD